MSIDLDNGTVHEKCLTCEKWVCECENDRALGVPDANGSGVNCAIASDPIETKPACKHCGRESNVLHSNGYCWPCLQNSDCLIAGGSATIRSAWVVVLSIGAVGLAILWEVVR